MTAQQHVDTSIAAFNDIKPKAPAIRDQVLAFITASIAGVSRTQIAASLDLNEITVGSRITELLQAGKIKRKGETTLSTSGKSEHLYVVGDGVPLPKPVVVKETTVNQTRLVEILRKLGVSASDVDASLYYANEAEGAEFWFNVQAALEANA
jgi:hypothetical protein